MQTEQHLAAGRYALNGEGRLYSCRGPWRRNAVAVVTVKPREAVPEPVAAVASEPTKRMAATLGAPFKLGISRAPGSVAAPDRSPTVVDDDDDELIDFPGIGMISDPAAGRSMARFKPMGLRSAEDEAAAAYERAVNGGRDS